MAKKLTANQPRLKEDQIFSTNKEEALALFETLLNSEWNKKRILEDTNVQISSLLNSKDTQPEDYFKIEKRWYSSIENNPDYNVYDEEYYLSEAFACWYVYAKRYLKDLFKIQELSNIHSVVDLGCGIGFSTCQLSQHFTNAVVFGTNIKNTKQWQVAEKLQSLFGFYMIEDIFFHVDLIFASEYFEHFQEPIKHLEKVISISTPKYIVTANSFTAKSIGHFNQYIVDEKRIENKKTGRIFNLRLMTLGYKRMNTKFWNNRPSIWKRDDL